MRVFGVLTVLLGLAGTAVSAQSFAAFGFKPPAELAVPGFRDDELTGLIGTLDRLLAADNRADSWSEALRQFARRLQTGRLSAAQEQKVVAHLDQIAAAKPEARTLVAGPRRMIRELTVGKTAPDITGTDLDGRALKLSEYRDKVVVLEFSAEWCGICRAQEPYERFLLDRYDKWPLAVLGVQTGSSREAARQAQLASPLSHRSWWDQPASGEANGPIAGAWNVIGWPATYVIDGDGVIRFVDLRDEDLLKAVRQLVDAQVDRDAKTKRPK
jgi:peroxiredoxin